MQSRREFLATTALSAPVLATIGCATRSAEDDAARNAAGDTAVAVGDATAGEPWTMFIGTYTKSGASKGIYRASVQPRTLSMGDLTLAAGCADPSYLSWGPGKRVLVAVNELLEMDGVSTGGVSAFSHEPARHTLASNGVMQRSQGAAPCYVSVDRTGRWALVANYMGGNVAVLPIDERGTLGPATTVLTHSGTGPNAARQGGPHAHSIIFDAAQEYVYSADLGNDRIYVYAFDARQGTLVEAAAPVALAPGAGPRHIAFSRTRNVLYCVNELDSTIALLVREGTRGGLRVVSVVSTRPAGATGANAPADLHVHPTGRTVYVSNRGDNTIAVFSTAAEGALSLVQTIPSGGDWPRNFTLTPDGRGLLVAHQRSDSVTAFHIDDRGELSPAGTVLTAPVPVCLLFD